MIKKLGGGLEPLGPIGVYAYASGCPIDVMLCSRAVCPSWVCADMGSGML